MKRILLACRLFWFGLSHKDMFGEAVFKSLSKLMEFILKTSIDDRPFCAHVSVGDNRIVSLWAYPGVSKNPVDRIMELLKEIDELKQMANQSVEADAETDPRR